MTTTLTKRHAAQLDLARERGWLDNGGPRALAGAWWRWCEIHARPVVLVRHTRRRRARIEYDLIYSGRLSPLGFAEMLRLALGGRGTHKRRPIVGAMYGYIWTSSDDVPLLVRAVVDVIEEFSITM